MWKKIIANHFLDYIYTMWQKDMVNLFLDYIYNVAKDNGKSSENHTDNYRQL